MYLDHGLYSVGAHLLAALEQAAIGLDIKHLQANASLNEEGFYRKQSFDAIERGTHRLASGQEVAYVNLH